MTHGVFVLGAPAWQGWGSYRRVQVSDTPPRAAGGAAPAAEAYLVESRVAAMHHCTPAFERLAWRPVHMSPMFVFCVCGVCACACLWRVADLLPRAPSISSAGRWYSVGSGVCLWK